MRACLLPVRAGEISCRLLGCAVEAFDPDGKSLWQVKVTSEVLGPPRVADGIVVVFTGGTLGFMALLDESWHEALYRTIMTASLTGLDSTPHGLGAELLTIAIVISGGGLSASASSGGTHVSFTVTGICSFDVVVDLRGPLGVMREHGGIPQAQGRRHPSG